MIQLGALTIAPSEAAQRFSRASEAEELPRALPKPNPELTATSPPFWPGGAG